MSKTPPACRLALLQQWPGLQAALIDPATPAILTPVAGDASFRRYYRVSADQTRCGHPLIVMDAPPSHEDSFPFIRLAQAWRRHGIRVPQVMAYDFALGVALLEDFGDSVLLKGLNDTHVEQDYRQALDQLVDIQCLPCDASADYPLPTYNADLLQREMDLFDTWLIQGWLGERIPPWLSSSFQQWRETLVQCALAQPQVTVHRDYHSRNLMRQPDGTLGIIDFQDAVRGPLTYDVISLLKDSYRRWPRQRQRHWLRHWHRQAQVAGVPGADTLSSRALQEAFDTMSMQRHLKVAGIFARLFLRDGRTQYLADIPRTLQHLIEALQEYPQWADITQWLEQQIYPRVCLQLNTPQPDE
ncbi:hypothetical protein BFW38_02310 [Terasakiispira papahanaumokuakeensis]|uniref:Aminoglycoside phosphotransferase domain-containing protein n=1 Tax=Terasakiispira papahanaumokuakeensis TaxID=197479 RepID=A0A1E2V6B1_9GAMM|nr:phosphotransferase [Terasakiispira papahanaumokuakeensis]ODC02550.1 hypothetical protein BFW38_02310 [Terasakiispira papahanaumokuakeensis]